MATNNPWCFHVRRPCGIQGGVGFALWIDGDMVWAQGLHEYRPLGVAVASITDLFLPRDFSPARQAPSRSAATYAGLFASLEDLNRRLAAGSRSQACAKKSSRPISSSTPWV
jgi:hypothetical protein